MADDTNVAPEGGDLFSPDERAYFESRGEKPLPAEKPATEAPPPADDEPKERPEPTEAIEPREGEPKEPSKDERKVDYGALSEERSKRKAAEDKAREFELLNARMEERFKAWQDSTRPPPQQPKRAPRADEDIFGAVNHIQRTQEQQAKELDAYKKREAAAAQVRE